jgi:hypothetical protein
MKNISGDDEEENNGGEKHQRRKIIAGGVTRLCAIGALSAVCWRKQRALPRSVAACHVAKVA